MRQRKDWRENLSCSAAAARWCRDDVSLCLLHTAIAICKR